MNKNKMLLLREFKDGIRTNGENLMSCQLVTVPKIQIVGVIANQSAPIASLFMFPKENVSHVRKVIAKGGSLYDYFVSLFGETGAEVQDEHVITTNYITQSVFDSLENEAGWQLAQSYQGQDRTPENLVQLVSESGEVLYRNNTLHAVGQNPFAEIQYTGPRNVRQPEPEKAKTKAK